MLRLILISLLFVVGSVSATPFDIQISGKTAQATISLPGGFEVDVTLSFENVMGLTAENLNISAYIANPLSADISQRLPSVLVTQQSAYPLVVRIEPLANSGFSFTGAMTVDFHTHNLQYSLNTPLRLFKSHDGATFEDITIATGAGSIRARGKLGDLSDFIIVADLRPRTVVVSEKALKLEQLLNRHASTLSPALLSSLQQHVSSINQLVATANYAAALVQTKQVLQLIQQADAADMPDVWRSARDINNVAGLLEAAAETLAYSLRLAV